MKLRTFMLAIITRIGLLGLAITQLASAVSYSTVVGSGAAYVLSAHGITQPVFGAIALIASVPLEISIIKHYAKPKTAEVPKDIQDASKKLKSMEAKYGKDWLDRVSAVADTLSKLDKKK